MPETNRPVQPLSLAREPLSLARDQLPSLPMVGSPVVSSKLLPLSGMNLILLMARSLTLARSPLMVPPMVRLLNSAELMPLLASTPVPVKLMLVETLRPVKVQLVLSLMPA